MKLIVVDTSSFDFENRKAFHETHDEMQNEEFDYVALRCKMLNTEKTHDGHEVPLKLQATNANDAW